MTVSAAVRWPLVDCTPKAPLRATVARHIFERVVGVIPVRATLPDGRRIGGGDADAPEFQIVRPEAFFARLGRDTKIGVSEAYMDGDWKAAPGTDLADLLTPFAANLTSLVPRPLQRLRGVVDRRIPPQHENTIEGSRDNVRAHYDLSNDLFVAFLDPTLSYSSAWFDESEPIAAATDLEAAQLRKTDGVLEWAHRNRLSPADGGLDEGGTVRAGQDVGRPVGAPQMRRPGQRRRRKVVTVHVALPRHLLRTSAAVLATAVIGSLGTDVRSDWYRSLDKPAWQPPGAAFGPAWTTLYGLMSLASARVLDRTDDPRERRAFAAASGTNLVLNAAWNWLLFKARRPRWALAETVVLEASTLDLTRRAGRADPMAATMLAPYAGWVGFATALNAAIARRNPGR